MSKKYKGTGAISLVAPDLLHKDAFLMVKMEPKDINFFMKIMEGYSHLGFVTPIQPTEGLLAIHATNGTISEIRDILHNSPRQLVF